jgi:hypothetical protein
MQNDENGSTCDRAMVFTVFGLQRNASRSARAMCADAGSKPPSFRNDVAHHSEIAFNPRVAWPGGPFFPA